MDDKPFHYKYPHPAVTTDCVIFGFDGEKLQVLLIERGLDPYKGCWAFPGGFVEMNESCEEGALRELQEETGLTSAYIEQFHTYSNPQRDPRERVITVAYYALVKLQEVEGGDDAAQARWFPLDEVPQLAFDHEEILQQALKTLRESIHFRPIGFELLPDKFSMTQLRVLYEAVLGVKFDRRNFAKKLLHYGVIVPLDERKIVCGHISAQLYVFNRTNYEAIRQKNFQVEF